MAVALLFWRSAVDSTHHRAVSPRPWLGFVWRGRDTKTKSRWRSGTRTTVVHCSTKLFRQILPGDSFFPRRLFPLRRPHFASHSETLAWSVNMPLPWFSVYYIVGARGPYLTGGKTRLRRTPRRGKWTSGSGMRVHCVPCRRNLDADEIVQASLEGA